MKLPVAVLVYCCCFLFSSATEDNNDICSYKFVFYQCHNFDKTAFEYVDAWAPMRQMELRGPFSDITIDARYKSLEELRLVSPELTTFQLRNLNNLQSLEAVDASGAKIKLVDTIGVEGLDILEELDFSENNIGEIRGGFGRLFSLQRLDLRMNALESFDFSSLPPSLQSVDLQYNKLNRFTLANRAAALSLPDVTVSCSCLLVSALAKELRSVTGKLTRRGTFHCVKPFDAAACEDDFKFIGDIAFKAADVVFAPAALDDADKNLEATLEEIEKDRRAGEAADAVKKTEVRITPEAVLSGSTVSRGSSVAVMLAVSLAFLLSQATLY